MSRVSRAAVVFLVVGFPRGGQVDVPAAEAATGSLPLVPVGFVVVLGASGALLRLA